MEVEMEMLHWGEQGHLHHRWVDRRSLCVSAAAPLAPGRQGRPLRWREDPGGGHQEPAHGGGVSGEMGRTSGGEADTVQNVVLEGEGLVAVLACRCVRPAGRPARLTRL